MKHIFTVFFLALILTACSQPAGQRRNLVMICIDTVRADNFWALANDRPDDALSIQLNSALRYRAAHSSAPWTIPTIASVFTGYYPRQHGAGYFSEPVANLDVQIPSQLDESMTTIAESLAAAGMATAAFPAHPWITADYGLQQGFETMQPRQGWKNINQGFFSWLENRDPQSEQPFFGYLHYMEAHDWHLKPRPELTGTLAEMPEDQLLWLKDYTQPTACEDSGHLICKRNKVYIHALQTLRQAVADVIQRLDQAQLLDDTIVVVFADHGEEFWDHRAEAVAAEEDPRDIFGFGHGQSMYQELLHVPLAVWHPDAGGVDIQHTVSLVDLYPSILDWLGVEHASTPLPGESLPLDNQPREQARVIYASGNSYGPQKIATREGGRKTIWHLQTDQQLYFDLHQDPAEKHSLADDKWVLRSDTLLGDYLELESLSLGATPELSESQLEHLKSIGYLQGLEETDQYPPPDEQADTGDETAGQQENDH